MLLDACVSLKGSVIMTGTLCDNVTAVDSQQLTFIALLMPFTAMLPVTFPTAYIMNAKIFYHIFKIKQFNHKTS